MTLNKINLENIRASLTLNNFVIFLVFLFPVTAATVKGAGDLIMFVLLIIGMTSFRFSDLKLLEKDKYIFIGFLALFLVGALSMVNTENAVEGLKKLERLAAFPLSIFIYLYVLKNRLNLTQTFINGVMIAVIVMAWQAWYQVEVLKYTNAIGAYHKIIFGDTAMLMAVLLAVYSYFKVNHGRNYFIYVLLMVFALYASLLSNTRGAWVLLPVLLVMVFGFVILKHRLKKKDVWVLVFLLVLVSVFVLTNDYIYQKFTREFVRLPDYLNETSVGQGNLHWRIIVWKMSLQIWGQNFLLGTGLGDLLADTTEIIRKGYMNKQAGYIAEHAHSIYFDALATMGVLGLIVVVLSLAFIPLYVLRELVCKKHCDSYLVVSVVIFIVSFMVFGLSEGLLSRKSFINLYLLIMLIYISELRLDAASISFDLEKKSRFVGLAYVVASGSKKISVLLSMVFLFVVVVFSVNERINYNSLPSEEKFLIDYFKNVFGRKSFVISDKVNITKDFLSKARAAYIVVPDEDMSCYGHYNNLYIYNRNHLEKRNLADRLKLEGGFSKVYLSGDFDDQEIVVSNRALVTSCRLDFTEINPRNVIKSKSYKIKNEVLHMTSNGYFLSPLYDVNAGLYSLEVEVTSSCVNGQCAKMRLEVFRQDYGSSSEVVIYNNVIESDENWEKQLLHYDVGVRSKMYYKLSFINDYHNKEDKQDINLFVREMGVSSRL